MTPLPSDFLNSLETCKLPDPEGFVRTHELNEDLVSVRFNPFKPVLSLLNTGERVKWCQHGYYLNSRPNFTQDPLFQAGCYYVQEAGSMFLESALKTYVDFSRDLNVLDLCGAPGGKSTHLSSLLSANSLLVSNELIQNRSQVLAYNLSKWGRSHSVVTNNPVEHFSRLKGFFDLLVVDAPCSGSGLFRKQEEAIQEWSPQHVQSCSLRQKKILESALPALKTGAYLFYSTCSYSREENEEVVDWLCREMRMELCQVEVPASWQLVTEGKGWRFYPHLTKSEGFFCAVLRKTEETQEEKPKKGGLEEEKTGESELSVLKKFIGEAEPEIWKRNGRFYLSNGAVRAFMKDFGKGFYFRKAGCQMGGLKNAELIPDHELALSLELNPEFPKLELGQAEALRYLKKESWTGDFGFKGWVLVTHQSYGIGWAKLLDRRMNNYLPAHWRVLK